MCMARLLVELPGNRVLGFVASGRDRDLMTVETSRGVECQPAFRDDWRRCVI